MCIVFLLHRLPVIGSLLIDAIVGQCSQDVIVAIMAGAELFIAIIKELNAHYFFVCRILLSLK